MSATKKILKDLESLQNALALNIEERIRETVTRRDRFNLVVAGGNTPRGLYERLAARPAGSLPWEQVHLYWGDERFVPQADPKSNYAMVEETLLDHIEIPAANIHSIPTDTEQVEQAAAVYEERLRAEFGDQAPSLDLILLGMGSDGHTASLFPGCPVLEEDQRWVGASNAPVEPKERITLTYPILNNARAVYFLVSGARKADAVRNAVLRDLEKNACPSAFVRPAGELIFWLDQAAAQLVPKD